jgi:hypothetical protein
MIGPKIETRMVVTKLIVHLIAALHSLVTPFLTVLDAVRAVARDWL